MSPLLDALIVLLGTWRQVFRQQRSFERALRLSLAQILTPGQRWLSRLIASSGRQHQDWSADYKLFSRSPWQPDTLFQPVIERCLEHGQQRAYVVLAGDFTHLPKTGRHIPNVHCMRDPMSPPYHVNLIQGLRYFQLTAILPLYRCTQEPSPRAAYRFVLVKCLCLKDRDAKLRSKSTRPIGRLKKSASAVRTLCKRQKLYVERLIRPAPKTKPC
jgi:hypothetical protein